VSTSYPYPNKALIGIVKGYHFIKGRVELKKRVIHFPKNIVCAKPVDVLVLNDKTIAKFLVLLIYNCFSLFLSKIMHDILNLIGI